MASPVVRWLARAVANTFYRVDRSGHVPASGAVLLVPNHPNALLDPAVVWATAGRDVRFLAKSTLFEGAFGPILKGAGGIPVYRRLDQGVDTSRNAETFAAVDAALRDGDAVCIFPEGISHSEGKLVPLRTGAARMALAAERGGTPVQLVAVGLNFDRKTAFRSRVTVLYGRPFSVRDLLQAGSSEHDAVRATTARIANEMRRLLVEADPEDDAAMVARVERLYSAARGKPRSPEERIARRQAIALGIERLRDHDAARFSELRLRLDRYDRRLRRFGLRDRHLDWDLSAVAAVRFVLAEGVLGLVLLPLAASSVALFWVPYQVTGRLAWVATKERDVAATAKVFVGAGVYAAWLAAIAAVVWQLAGGAAAALVAILLPVIAVAGLFAFEREAAVIDTARGWLLLRRARHQTRTRLKQARTDLAMLLDQAYEWVSGERPAPAAVQKPN
jgi:glycerol-3-phosphate O-acyltransferase / dihydroxyacetone phosphate acyltransferase